MSGWQHVPHTWKPLPLKRLSYLYCIGCGLVRLRNRLTDWCVAKGCDHTEHPGYKAAVQLLGTREP